MAWSPPLPKAKSSAPAANFRFSFMLSPSIPIPILTVTGSVFSWSICLILSNIENLSDSKTLSSFLF